MLGGLRIRFSSCCWLCFRLMMMLQDCCCFYGDRNLLSGTESQPNIPYPQHSNLPLFSSLQRTCLPGDHLKEKWKEGKKERKQEREVTQSCLTLCDPMGCSPPGSSARGIFQARILEWVAISFSGGIFPTQGLNPGLPHCRQTLYHLSHQGSLVST